VELTARTVKITAASDIFHWGGCFAENGLFLILEVCGDETKPAVVVGREILELILTRFADAKERNWTTLNAILVACTNPSVVTFTIGILDKDVLYLGNKGEGEVLIARSGKIGKILSANGTSSGKSQLSDRLLFSSKTFMSSVPDEKRRNLLMIEEEQEEIEGLSALLGKPGTAGAAALCLTIEEMEIKKEFSVPSFSVLKRKGLSGISRMRNKINGLSSYIKPREAQTWQTDEEIKHKKIFLTVAIILIGLLFMSVFFNMRTTRSAKERERLAQAIDLVSHQFDEATSLIDLNPARSRSLLSDSKLTLSPLIKEFPKNSSEYKEINEWLGKIAEKEVMAYKIYKLTSVPVFFDISLIKDGGSGNAMRSYREMKVILDSKNKLVYSLSTDTKKAEIIAGSETVKDGKMLSVHGKNAYLLNSDGIVRIDIAGKKSQVVIKTDEKWGDIGSLAAFGGNVYLLDRKKNAVWKYIASDFGFLERQNYLNPDVRVDFSNVRELIIDGSIWVSTPGEILKFTKGLGEAFAFKDFSDTLANISAFTTSDEDKNIYLLDKQGSRIVVFDKDGVYRAQYQWDELKNADDIVASEEENKIFVLSASKIYAIDIKQ